MPFFFFVKKVSALSYDSSHCGQTIEISNGNYLEELFISATCSSSNPLTIRAESDGLVRFDGQNIRRPCQISDSSWVTLEGIVCHHSENMVFGIHNSDNITLKKVTVYQAGPDYADHVFEIYRCNNVTLEDCAASGRGRNTYLAFESDFITFRRCWGRYITNGTEQGADWMQIYGSSDSLIENCVGTRSTSDIFVDINQYWYASWNRDVDRVDRNRTFGSVFYGHDYHGLNIISANQQLHGNSVENSVFIGNDDSLMGFGIPYTGIFQRADDNLTIDHLTLVNHQTAVSLSHDSSNPWFDIIGDLSNSSILNGTNGISVANYTEITTDLNHRYNNFYNVGTLYTGTSQGQGEISIDPGYDTTTYGKGAYLFVPPALKAQGEGGADIGAEILYQSEQGSQTSQPLWPWPMEARICAETANILGEGISVTYESNQVQYDYNNDGQSEAYNCTGGIWKAHDLSDVYGTPDLPRCLGANNTIDGDDVEVWADNYLQEQSLFDMNDDGVLNSIDFGHLLSYWGEECTH